MSTTPSGPAKQPGTGRTTDKGPHGGGTKYTQMSKLGRDCVAIPPITGHKQVKNVTNAGPRND